MEDKASGLVVGSGVTELDANKTPRSLVGRDGEPQFSVIEPRALLNGSLVIM